MKKILREILGLISKPFVFCGKCISFVWSCLSFGLKQIVVFVKNVAIVLGIVGAIVAILNGPGFAQSSRDSLETNIHRAFYHEWRNNEVLDVCFTVESTLIFNESDIKEKVKKEVDKWNRRVKYDIAKKNDGFAIEKELPLHYVRAFFCNGKVYFVSDNVVGIPEMILKSEIK